MLTSRRALAAALLLATSLTLPALGALAAGTAGTKSKPAPRRPKITEIRIDKSDHTLQLLADTQVVKSYKVAIGPGGAGPKLYQGDKRTPVGTYRVQGRIKGLFHQFLTVSYPNDEDRVRYAESKRRGEIPKGRGIGFGIGIHGVGSPELAGDHKLSDWTLGCIALDDDEIDEVARLVPDGTRIVITD
ncbi:L,D-transpeptidase family protein [Chondromyces apiculatus]|uniref:ErfK/YbiS/YcfS/YnhG n=1 Tax=Chondromyces apiculatus DSM 436 TaxID=1192034 RepID=A0A017SZ01_9BACT|nr:L,D-transpeptidase family protein [Chondromyces apiculatus]EYF01516.1 ErfK/YbiS/YcfS/YnhG [Chondromyces apiculatus DSM 436]